MVFSRETASNVLHQGLRKLARAAGRLFEGGLLFGRSYVLRSCHYNGYLVMQRDLIWISVDLRRCLIDTS
jgi:hypothetical protein